PNPERLEEIIRTNRVSTLWLTASLFNLVMNEAPQTLRGVSQLLIGGEQLSTPHVRKAQQELDGTQIINGYGPTESTTFACTYAIPRDIADTEILPIGRPIANTRAYILDVNRQPVPAGIPGELYIGGDGLARGYHNRPDLTDERFIPDPFDAEEGARLYKTGDLVRYRRDAAIEFLGRMDHQVKIRGFRIELDEIEAVLGQYPEVGEAAVVMREDAPGEKMLVAYIVPKAKNEVALATDEIRRFLKRKLPAYMVPYTFVLLQRMKYTSSGKIDRKSLPAPERQKASELDGTRISPRTAIEEKLAKIMAEVLGLKNIGINDSFFELGGHSLKATQMITRVRHVFHIDLPLSRIFESPTVEGLAEQIQSIVCLTPAAASGIGSSIIPIQCSGSNPPLFIPHDLSGDVGFANRLSLYLGSDQPVYGLHNTSKADVSKMGSTMEEFAARYVNDLVAFHPKGPYCLGGYSFGAILAYEIARQLRNRGLEVGHLGIVDAGPSLPKAISPNLILAGTSNFLKNVPLWLWDDLLKCPSKELQARLLRKAKQIKKGFQKMVRSGIRAGLVKDLEDIFDLQHWEGDVLEKMEHHMKLLQEYVPGSYSGPLTLYRARTQAFFQFSTFDLGWGAIVNGDVEIVNIPGCHDNLLRKPYVLFLAKAFNTSIAKLSN
ncbi:MAG TPA: AMP-binding protein, partial [Terriglobia bacterium]|nr:AMP-binding protein [Terriglobia bacterium]